MQKKLTTFCNLITLPAHFLHLKEKAKKRTKMKNSFVAIKIISWLFFNRMNCWQMESVKWNNFSLFFRWKNRDLWELHKITIRVKNFSLLPLTQASKQTSWCTRWYFAFVDDCLFMSCWILKFIFNKFLTLRAASKVVEKVLSALKLINIWIYFQNELLKKSVFYFTLRFSNKELKKPRKTLIFLKKF